MFDALHHLVMLLPPMVVRITPMYAVWALIGIGLYGEVRWWRRQLGRR